ncbi:CAMK family protein kinase [Histoplasma capsulatum G186AR]|uniref:Serine/threonine-protein kinase ATG1 n=1 Tax=Ajellomyces capsulatus TaxID=5037 RepID=A0A8H7YT94_AJECA|nr:CAMK family protein kinase [Histoplasma capsulatum]QSS73733.1 CAMK family protein kinase [Histoplasma capsulatum G186AR]
MDIRPFALSPRQVPHSRALFSLVPLNQNAHSVINNPLNRRFLSRFVDNNMQYVGLDIGFHVQSSTRYTLATLGRSGADITVDGPSISRIQCSFETHAESDVVMLYDRSNSQTTEVFGVGCVPFEPGRRRRIVVRSDVNCMLSMGGNEEDLVQFRLVWHRVEFNANYEVANRVETPMQARTIDNIPTAAPSRLPSIQVPVHHEPQIRYKELAPLGAGAYGTVSKVIDMDSGKFMAVKCVRPPPGGFKDWDLTRLQREIEALYNCSHPNIIEYIRYQRLSERFEIFMALKEGNVDYLIQRCVFDEHEHCGNNLLHQMLSALDYLASYGIIHRDVKPANILYTTLGKLDYRYYLTDFGFCNSVDQARSGVGSLMYMAPELLQGNQFPQTPKADIWSLFVTLAWAVNADNYRSQNLFTAEEIVSAALDAARTERMHHLKDMAEIEPDKRASSSQMLLRHYNGIGRTIPLEQVETTTSAKHTQEDVIMGSTSPQLGWPPPGPTYPSPQTALTTGLGISTFDERPQ